VSVDIEATDEAATTTTTGTRHGARCDVVHASACSLIQSAQHAASPPNVYYCRPLISRNQRIIEQRKRLRYQSSARSSHHYANKPKSILIEPNQKEKENKFTYCKFRISHRNMHLLIIVLLFF